MTTSQHHVGPMTFPTRRTQTAFVVERRHQRSFSSAGAYFGDVQRSSVAHDVTMHSVTPAVVRYTSHVAPCTHVFTSASKPGAISYASASRPITSTDAEITNSRVSQEPQIVNVATRGSNADQRATNQDLKSHLINDARGRDDHGSQVGNSNAADSSLGTESIPSVPTWIPKQVSCGDDISETSAGSISDGIKEDITISDGTTEDITIASGIGDATTESAIEQTHQADFASNGVQDTTLTRGAGTSLAAFDQATQPPRSSGETTATFGQLYDLWRSHRHSAEPLCERESETLARLFYETMPSERVKLVKMERVEHPDILSAFCDEERRSLTLEREKKKTHKELMMLHGTGWDNAQAIKTEGLDPDLGHQSRGAWLGQNAEACHTYAAKGPGPEQDNGRRCFTMFAVACVPHIHEGDEERSFGVWRIMSRRRMCPAYLLTYVAPLEIRARRQRCRFSSPQRSCSPSGRSPSRCATTCSIDSSSKVVSQRNREESLRATMRNPLSTTNDDIAGSPCSRNVSRQASLPDRSCLDNMDLICDVLCAAEERRASAIPRSKSALSPRAHSAFRCDSRKPVWRSTRASRARASCSSISGPPTRELQPDNECATRGLNSNFSSPSSGQPIDALDESLEAKSSAAKVMETRQRSKTRSSNISGDAALSPMTCVRTPRKLLRRQSCPEVVADHSTIETSGEGTAVGSEQRSECQAVAEPSLPRSTWPPTPRRGLEGFARPEGCVSLGGPGCVPLGGPVHAEEQSTCQNHSPLNAQPNMATPSVRLGNRIRQSASVQLPPGQPLGAVQHSPIEVVRGGCSPLLVPRNHMRNRSIGSLPGEWEPMHVPPSQARDVEKLVGEACENPVSPRDCLSRPGPEELIAQRHNVGRFFEGKFRPNVRIAAGPGGSAQIPPGPFCQVVGVVQRSATECQPLPTVQNHFGLRTYSTGVSTRDRKET